jgi:hypothetical protein
VGRKAWYAKKINPIIADTATTFQNHIESLADLHPGVLVLAREGNDRLVRTLALRQVRLDGMEVLDGPRNPARDHHRARLSADLPGRQHLFMEVIHHDLGLELDRVVVALATSQEQLKALNENYEKAAKNTLQLVDNHRKDVEELVGVIGNLGVTSGYQKTANTARLR